MSPSLSRSFASTKMNRTKEQMRKQNKNRQRRTKETNSNINALRSVPDFLILPYLKPDDITRQGEMSCLNWKVLCKLLILQTKDAVLIRFHVKKNTFIYILCNMYVIILYLLYRFSSTLLREDHFTTPFGYPHQMLGAPLNANAF